MKFPKRIVCLGHSYGIIVDRPIMDKLKLIKGNWVEVELKKIKD